MTKGNLREFADRVGVMPEMTFFQDKTVLEKGCLSADKLYMTRGVPDREKADSGWFAGAQQRNNEAAAEFEAIYAFQLLINRPSLFPALILPTGFMVMVGQERIEGVMNSSNELVMCG